MEQYEDTEETRERVLSNGQVLAFIASYWVRRRWLLATTVVLTLVAVALELLLPRFSGELIDTITAGRREPRPVWIAWGAFSGAYLGFAVIRNIAFRFW